MSKVFLSIVIPSYDEMANLQKGVLDKLDHFLGKASYEYEIIIVDDGSTDGSCEFVEQYALENKGITLIKNSHTGKAGAVTTGILAAKGEYILFTDMDQATPIEQVEKLLPYITDGYDIAIGSRNKTRKGAPLTRKIMANANIVLRSMLIGLSDIKDTQCGFKLFTQQSAQDIFKRIKDINKGFQSINGSAVTAGFDIEILYIAQKLGYKIKEVPVDWLYVETRRVNPIKDSVEGLLDLLRIRGNIVKGVYK